MPSANDNFANASSISGANGNTDGSNIGAGVEAGEPSGTNTVWWAWTCPDNDDYYFETRGNNGTTFTDFKSAVKVFTGSAVNALTEMSYLMNQSAGFGNGFEFGSFVAFTATAGTVYYIRVDGRGGATGNIFLQWNTFVAARLGNCSNCPVDFQSEDCVGSLQITDVTFGTPTPPYAWQQTYYPFGSFNAAAGVYKILYCGGAYKDYFNVFWRMWSGSGYCCDRTVLGSDLLSCGESSTDTRASVEEECACGTIFLPCHTGGEIGILWPGSSTLPFYTHGVDKGTPNLPRFQLIFNPLTISMLAPAGCGISGSGTSWSLSINVQNLSVIAWPGVSFALQNSGGISGASAAVTSDLAANSTTSGIGPITFTADPTSGLITATIQVSLCGVVAFNLTFPLYPVVALSYYATTTGGCAVACVNTFVQAVVIASPFPGLANVTLTGTSSPLSLINPSTGLVVSSTTATVGNGTTHQALRLAVRDPGTPTGNIFTVAVSWRGFTLPPYTFVRTIS